MELRHLRYFVAIAEAGSMTVAAGRKLHTSQPSLSRQIRDLEEEVGAQLLTRRARGIALTPAGRTFPRPCSPGAIASRRGRRSGPPGRESQQAMLHHGISDRTRINVDA
jgi:DNA-binding transcriptional LysR family regulator